MSLIGLICAAAASIAMLRSQIWTLAIFGISALLLAASAVSLGPANVTPGHLVLAVFLIAVAIRLPDLNPILAPLAYPHAGFFLLLTTIWAIFASVLLPRLFAGAFQVIPLTTNALIYIYEPLRPSSSNLNQLVYFCGNLATFAAVASLTRSPHQMRRIAIAVLIVGGVNVGFGILDFVTYSIGLSNLMEFVRNADYAQANAAISGGIRRLVGTAPEASAFAKLSVGLFAFSFRLWRGGMFAPWSGWISLGLFLGIALTVSSSGYVALGVYLAIVYSISLMGLDRSFGNTKTVLNRRLFLISLGPFGALILMVILSLNPGILDPVLRIFDESIATKLTSSSGVERTSWNINGINAFFQSFGLGVGLGTVRVSSLLVAIPATLGIIGVMLFGQFLWRLLRPKINPSNTKLHPEIANISAAGRSACLVVIFAACLGSTTPDLGLLFFIYAGIAAGPDVFFERHRRFLANEESRYADLEKRTIDEWVK